ncbi:MAG: LTA synthase family protein [Ruminococcaceae bacterium]|nr:LTA synthase family protein [Oscillospiraceae bacterium]
MAKICFKNIWQKFREFIKKSITSIQEFSNKKKFESDFKKSVGVIAILSLVCIVMQMIAQNGINILGYLSPIIRSPILLVLNFIPYFLVMLFLYAIFNRVWISFLITDLILTIALFVNHYKVVLRSETFKFTDIILVQEALNITQNYSFSLSFKMLLVALIGIVALVMTILIVKNKKGEYLKRFIAFTLSIVLMVTSFLGIYLNKQFYDSIPILAGDFNEVEIMSHKGFIYSFLTGIKRIEYKKPEGYTEEKQKNIMSKYEDVSSDYKPDIIAVMSESFFDIEQCEKIEFYPGMEPFDNFKKLKEEAMWGDMIVAGFGGGTVATEFEFLTGTNLSLIDGSLPNAYDTFIKKSVYSLPQVLKSQGYDTLAIHPGNKWFYNRESAYAKLGFDDFISIEDIKKPVEQVNYYTADSVTSKLIIDNYKNHIENSKNPYFSFTVTIQNHGPYDPNKTYEDKRYVRPDGMSNEFYNSVNNYVEGMQDSDEFIGDIMEYINSVDRPTYFVFFGDHLPYFDNQIYNEYLGYDVSCSTEESLIKKYKVPYLICANDAAKKHMKENGMELKNGEQPLISANFLSAKLVDYMGASVPKFYQFLNDVSKKINVIAPTYYFEDGKFTSQLSEEGKKLLNDYEMIQYKNINEYKKENGK